MLHYYIINWHLDAAAMVLVAIGAMLGVHIILRRRHGSRGVAPVAWVALAAILALGVLGTEFAGQYEKSRLRDMLEGIAPTYAMEMELLGHSSVDLETAANDAVYLSMIEAQDRKSVV